MFLNNVSKKSLIKKLNWLLESVNFSVEILEGASWKKVYRILKKVIKYKEIKQFSKSEIKNIAKLFSEGKLSEKKKVNIAKLILKIKEKYENDIDDININYSWPFLGTFFDKKQIIRC